MNLSEYYRILGVRQGASDDEIRKAYRRKAMECHPDRSGSADTADKFILITEAYEYLISHPYRRNISEEEARKNYDAWINYRREEARKQAEQYSRVSYTTFRKSPLYKSTSAIDGSIVFMGLILAIAIMAMTIYGYTTRMRLAETPREEPSLHLAIITFTIGFLYLVISILYLSAWVAQQKERKKKKNATQS